MNKKNLTTSWMWTFDGEFRGLYINSDTKIMNWYDNLECQCADEGSFAEQTIQGFRENGEPAGIGQLPMDVQAELNETLSALR
jgi:hypothetical protein